VVGGTTALAGVGLGSAIPINRTTTTLLRDGLTRRGQELR
jgi:hypothetical protein